MEDNTNLFQLGICVTSYNRQVEAIKLVHRLKDFTEDSKCAIGIYLYVDGGETDIIEKWKSVLHRGNISITINPNEGVYKSKVSNLSNASKDCDWLIHCDDDDMLNLKALSEIDENIYNGKYDNLDLDIIQFNCSKFDSTKGGFVNRFDLQKKDNHNCLCFNGLLMRSEAIHSRLLTYFKDDISTWSNTTESWGDDVLSPGYLTLDIPTHKMACVNKVLAQQDYIADEYHICSDPKVYKKCRSYCKKYLRFIPLKF